MHKLSTVFHQSNLIFILDMRVFNRLFINLCVHLRLAFSLAFFTKGTYSWQAIKDKAKRNTVADGPDGGLVILMIVVLKRH